MRAAGGSVRESLDGARGRGGRGRAAGPRARLPCFMLAPSRAIMLAPSRAMKPTRLPALAGSSSLALASGTARDGEYSGFVGPGYPISFRVEANGTVVKNLDVAI